jgi:hypothetical protein
MLLAVENVRIGPLQHTQDPCPVKVGHLLHLFFDSLREEPDAIVGLCRPLKKKRLKLPYSHGRRVYCSQGTVMNLSPQDALLMLF